MATRVLTRQKTDTILQAFLANDNTSLLFFHATDELSAQKNDTEGYISLIRPIFDTRATAGEGIVLGICEIQIPLKNFIIEPDLLTNKTYTILFKGNVIQEQGNLNTSKKYETFKRTIEQFPDFSIEIRANNIIEPTLRNSFIGIVILVTLLIGLLLFILEKIVLTRATNPLVELCNNMELYSLKESVQTVDKNELDEVGSLYNSFNNMVERLQNTVDELVAARTGQVEAQMLALQAQVNPHFIHNTLAIISSLAEEGKTDKVETITNKLSSLIRYSSDFSHKEKLLTQVSQKI